MQKKVLASILVAPLALSAFANIPINGNLASNGAEWDQTAITGKPSFVNGTITCPVGSGYIKYDLGELNPGDYILTFKDAVNVAASVTVGPNTYKIDSNDVLKFTVVAKTNCELIVSAAKANEPFSINGIDFQIDCDFAAIIADLNSQLGAININAVPEADKTPEAEALRTEKTALDKRLADLNTKVDTLTETKANYDQYELWKKAAEGGNLIDKDVKQLAADVKAYNEKVKAETEKYELGEANDQAKAALLASVTDLQSLLDAQKARYAKEALTNETEQKYVSGTNAPAAASIQAEIDLWKKAIEDAYADKYKEDITVENKEAAIKATIDTLEADITTSTADFAAYNRLAALQDALTAQTSAAVDSLEAEKYVGKAGMNKDFDAYVAAQKAAVRGIYGDALAAVATKKVEDPTVAGSLAGASENEAADTTILNNAKAAIEAALVDTEAALETYLNNVGVVEAEEAKLAALAKIPENTLPAEEQATYDNLVKAAEDAVAALKTQVNNDYDAVLDTAAAEAAIDAVDAYVAAWSPIIDLYKELEKLKADVRQMQTDSKVPTSKFDLYGKFELTENPSEGTFASLEAAIKAIYEGKKPGEFATATIPDVKAAIAEKKVLAQNLMDAYVDASSAIDKLQKGINDLDSYIATKLIVAESWVRDAFKSEKEYKKLGTELTKGKEELVLIAGNDINPQQSYEKAVALAATAEDWPGDVNNATKLFESTYTGENENAVSTALDALKTYVAEGSYYGQADVDYTALETELAGIQGEIAAANALASDDAKLVETFNGIDTKLNNLYTKIADKKAEVKALKDNQVAYDQLLALVPGTDKINEVKQYNLDNSKEPAKTYFDEKVIGKETPAPATGLYKERADLLAELRTALEAKKAVEQKTALDNKITAFKNKIDQTKNDVTANNTNYAAENVESATVRGKIDSIIAGIEAELERAAVTVGDGTPVGTAAKDALDELKKLRDTDLLDIDLDANGFYGKGECKDATVHQGIMDRYKAVGAAAEQIQSDFSTNFGDKVEATNAQTVKDANWTTVYDQANDAYRQAIETYNDYFKITNKSYREYILTVVETHRDIYQFSKLITDLNAEVEKFIADANAEKVVFTDFIFKEVANEKALRIIRAIEEKVAAMTNQCNEAADKYYNGESFNFTTLDNEGNPEDVTAEFKDSYVSYQEAEEAVEEATVRLEAIGVAPGNYNLAIGEANKHLSLAYETFNAPANKANLALDYMNSVADNIDAVVANINLDAAASAQWTDDYDAAKAQLDTLKDKLDDCTDENDSEIIAEFAGFETALNDLNSTPTGANTLAQKKWELNQLLDAAEKLVNDQYDKWSKDEANKAQLDAFNANLNKLYSDYAALVEYAAALAGTTSLDNINDAITNVANAIEANKASLVANKAYIEGLINTAKSEIAAGYKAVQTSEITALYDLLAKTKVAFNNAKVYTKTLTADQLAAYNTQIDNNEAAIVKANGLVDNAAKRADFKTEAAAVEQALADIYVALQSSYSADIDGTTLGGNPVPGILAELEEQYLAIESAITDANEAYLRSFPIVHENYPDGYSNIIAALEAVKENWTADGNKVVLNAETYKSDMNAINAEFQALKAQIEADQAAAVDKHNAMLANDAAFDRLNAEAEALEEQLNTLVELVQEYDLVRDYTAALNSLSESLEDARTQVALDHARVKLTADSQLPNGAYIASQIVHLTRQAEVRHMIDLRGKANKAINGAYTFLSDNTIVPEIKAEQNDVLAGLSGDMSAIANDYYELNGKYYNGDITEAEYLDGLHALDARYETVIANAEGVQTTANEYQFTPGDVNEAPDGEVNSADLQMLISWILEGTTYQELYAESPVQAAAADLTGDKSINIADATDLVDLILFPNGHADAADNAPRLVRRGVRTGDNTFGLTMLTSENGTRDYALTLNNGDTFIAGQFDVQLPVGMSVKDVVMDSRAADHQVMFSDNGNGNYRIVVFSMTNEAIAGNDGVLLHIITEGIGTPALANGIFADDQHAPVEVHEIHTSMVDTIYNGAVNVKERIYDAAGRSLRAVQRGINIIRKSDGTTTKELHK